MPPRGLSLVPGARGSVPVVILMRAISSPALKIIPKNDKLALATVPGMTDRDARRSPFLPKSSISVESARSTSLNTAPKPLTSAGVPPVVPGMKKRPWVVVLPTGVKTRFGLNTPKVSP